ncbi:MAG TPA: hypothetical protein VL096_16660, partial [Pirellulaceae bacterium]|nr:hypothetical protein [Pirellulaceae bacterium]
MTTQTLSNPQFDKTTIAELDASSIEQLTTDDLVRIIRVAELPLHQAAEVQHRLPYYDRATLSRLAHL